MNDGILQASVESGVARLVLNRPARLNALTRDLMVALRAALENADRRDDVRVISLSGAGRAFCAGQDLSERDPRVLDAPLDLAAIQRELFHPVIRAIAETSKPVVAKVNGVAAGAGASIALAADLVLACSSARFVFSFAKVGLSVDAGLGRSLVQAIGPARARGLLMTGGTLSAVDAAGVGLIWQAVPDENLNAVHDGTLRELAAAPRRAIAGIKKAVASADLPLPDYLAIEAELQGLAGAHPDYAEGVLSFLERRPAQFA